MRTPLCLVIVLVSALCALPHTAAAQPVASPTIQSVTLQPDTGVVTITGTGLGADLVVIIDGEPVTVLSGATATRVDVQPPATVLTTPGTYRLTVVDPARHSGDAFVVASQATTIPVGDTALSGSSNRTRVAAVAPAGDATERATGPAAQWPVSKAVSPAVIENNCNTAVGVGALQSNTNGCWNTGTGRLALASNTTGNYNTASGSDALSANSTGVANTATGYFALGENTTGGFNMASGYGALASNTTGAHNTASGYRALVDNTTGSRNSALGDSALGENTTGSNNTASGSRALDTNTTGWNNVANGAHALINNRVGNDNVATGTDALHNNTASYNTAHGTSALYNTTTGGWNVAVGQRAGFTATTGAYNVYLGAGVEGTAADTNTIRVGLPYSGGIGQNRTFIAGIFGTVLTGTVYNVYIDANGQLGTAPLTGGGGFLPMAQSERQISDLREQLREQHDVITDLRARLAKLEASAARRK